MIVGWVWVEFAAFGVIVSVGVMGLLGVLVGW